MLSDLEVVWVERRSGSKEITGSKNHSDRAISDISKRYQELEQFYVNEIEIIKWFFGNFNKIDDAKKHILLANACYNNQIQIVCKNNRNRMMQVKFDEAAIFQKLSTQERVILSVLDFLDK